MAGGRKRGASKAKANQLSLGDLVLAKVKGFPAWPAKISRPEDWEKAPDPKKYFVQFFGTEEIAFVGPGDIQEFDIEAKNKLLARCKSKTLKYFAQAVQEICAAFEESQQEKSSVGDDTDKSAAGSETASVVKEDGKMTELNDGASTAQQNGETIHRNINDSDSIGQLKTEREDIKASDITSPMKTPEDKGKVPDGSEEKPVFSPPGIHLKKENSGDEDIDVNKRELSAKTALANGLKKKIVTGSNKRLQATVEQHKTQNSSETKVKSSGSGTKNLSSKALKPGTDDGGRKNAADIKDSVVNSKNGISSNNKKRSQIEIGKNKLGTQESSHPTKKLKREDTGDVTGKGSSQSRSMKIDSPKKSNIVNEKVAKQSEAKKMISRVKGENHATPKSSNVGPDASGNEAVLPLTKRRRRAMEAMSDSTVLGSEDKMGAKPLVPKTDLSSPVTCKLSGTQQPRRRRAVCLSDDDDDEPKTPLHGGTTTNRVEPPTSSKSIIKANNENPSITSPSVRNSTGFKKESSSQFRHELLAPKTVEKKSTPQVSISPGKPDSEQLSIKESKLTFISPKKSPHMDSVTKPVEQNKSAKSVLKVSDAGTQKKLQAGPVKVPGGVSDGVNSSHNQAANQRNRLVSSGERPKSTPKTYPRKDDTPSALIETSVEHNHFPMEIFEAAGKEDRHSSVIDSKTPDASTTMRNLIAAAQAKRKQAHTQQYSLGNPNYAFMDMHGMTPSPSAAQPLLPGSGNLTQDDNNRANLESPSNHGRLSTVLNQPDAEEIEDRRVSSGHKAAGGSLSGDTEAAVARDAFEGMIETLSRTKESIGRATRLAIDCAKYNIANEVVELLIRKLESETSYHRKVDLFFLVDSITQCSHSQKGIAGASYIPTVQSALPRLLGAAAPPGTATRENRRQCLKVLRLWLERKIFPESVLRRHMDDIGGSNDDAVAGVNLRRPSRAERAVDDPIREMEGMLVDEYGSNATFQLPGLLPSHVFEDEDDDDDFSLKEAINNVSPPAAAAAEPNNDSELETCTPNDRRHHVLEDVDGELEMEDVSGHPKDERPPLLTDEMGSQIVEMDSNDNPCDSPPLPEGSPPLPLDSPPPLPPLPTSPPPPLPPSSPSPPPPPPPPPIMSQPPPRPVSMVPQPSTPTQPPVLAPLPAPPHLSGVQMGGSSSGIMPLGVSNSGFNSSRHMEYRNNVNPQGSQFQQVNPSFPQRPLHPTLPQTPPGHFPYANPAMHQQHPYPPRPYPFVTDEQWRMPTGNTDNQRNMWANGRPPPHSGSFIQEAYFRPPVERPPQTNMGFQHKSTNSLPAAPPYPAHGVSQMVPLRPDMSSLNCWRPA